MAIDEESRNLDRSHRLSRARKESPILCTADLLVFVEILLRHVVLRHLVRVDFSLLIVLNVLHTGHDISLESIPFLEQLVDTLRISALNVAQPL